MIPLTSFSFSEFEFFIYFSLFVLAIISSYLKIFQPLLLLNFFSFLRYFSYPHFLFFEIVI